MQEFSKHPMEHSNRGAKYQKGISNESIEIKLKPKVPSKVDHHNPGEEIKHGLSTNALPEKVDNHYFLSLRPLEPQEATGGFSRFSRGMTKAYRRLLDGLGRKPSLPRWRIVASSFTVSQEFWHCL
jgi:hypothetical protein